MRTVPFIIGAAAGIVIATAAMTSMYPDVPRRMVRDTRRLMRSGRRMVNGILH